MSFFVCRKPCHPGNVPRYSLSVIPQRPSGTLASLTKFALKTIVEKCLRSRIQQVDATDVTRIVVAHLERWYACVPDLHQGSGWIVWMLHISYRRGISRPQCCAAEMYSLQCSYQRRLECHRGSCAARRFHQ